LEFFLFTVREQFRPNNYPNDYIDIKIDRLKTGKGEVLELSSGVLLKNVVEILPNNTVFTTPGVVLRPQSWTDNVVKDEWHLLNYIYLMGGPNAVGDNRSIYVGKKSFRTFPANELSDPCFSLHGKMNTTLTKYQDSTYLFSFYLQNITERTFIRYLPGGERGLFFREKEEDNKINKLSVFNMVDVGASHREVLVREAPKQVKLDNERLQKQVKRDKEHLEWANAWDKGFQDMVKEVPKEVEKELKRYKETLRNPQPGSRIKLGLVLKREGNRVLVQPRDGKAADAKWYNISDLY
jgi:hypothetical protein